MTTGQTAADIIWDYHHIVPDTLVEVRDAALSFSATHNSFSDEENNAVYLRSHALVCCLRNSDKIKQFTVVSTLKGMNAGLTDKKAIDLDLGTGEAVAATDGGNDKVNTRNSVQIQKMKPKHETKTRNRDPFLCSQIGDELPGDIKAKAQAAFQRYV